MAENMRTVRLGIDKKYLDIINSVLGQMSDGYWENTPRMRGYWLFADAKAQGNECVLEIDPTRWGTRRGYSNVTNQWIDMNDAKVKQFLADKIKFLVKEEGLDWNRGNEDTTDYLSYTQPYFKVKDCYYVYELLKGRNVNKHPEYSEAFYAKKNGKEFQIEIELVDGPNAEDPDKITVIVGDKSATVDVPKDGTEDHYRTAVAAGLKKLGYEMGEGKPADEANEAGLAIPKAPLYAIGYNRGDSLGGAIFLNDLSDITAVSDKFADKFYRASAGALRPRNKEDIPRLIKAAKEIGVAFYTENHIDTNRGEAIDVRTLTIFPIPELPGKAAAGYKIAVIGKDIIPFSEVGNYMAKWAEENGFDYAKTYFRKK